MSDDEGFAARRRRRRMREDSEEDNSEKNGIGSRQSSEESVDPEQGTVFNKLSESKRKAIQQQLLDGIFTHAEKKYGRKKPQRSTGGEEELKRSPMEDYELYLRSLNIKVKSSSDKVAVILKQKRDIDAKLAEAEKEQNAHQTKYNKADEEKQNAIKENRDPILPKDFIVPQRVKGRGKAAGLGAIVMKASSQMWEDKFNASRAKKNTETPEWMAKQKKADKTSTLLNVGRNKMDSRKDKKSESTNKFSAASLNKTSKTEAKSKETIPEKKPAEEEKEDSIRTRRNRVPKSDDEEFDI